MISFLEGKIIFKGLGFIILKTEGGVGYKIFISSNFFDLTRHTREQVGKNEEENAKLWTHLSVRENAMELYGFINYAELEFFETLLKVSGVGPKSAIAVFNVASVDVLKNAIASGESGYLTRVSGIGRKTAEKIIVELKDKFGGKDGANFQYKEDTDVYEALLSLGYSARDARATINEIEKTISGVENRVKAALKILGK